MTVFEHRSAGQTQPVDEIGGLFRQNAMNGRALHEGRACRERSYPAESNSSRERCSGLPSGA
jgi:hypothetical protein